MTGGPIVLPPLLHAQHITELSSPAEGMDHSKPPQIYNVQCAKPTEIHEIAPELPRTIDGTAND